MLYADACSYNTPSNYSLIRHFANFEKSSIKHTDIIDSFILFTVATLISQLKQNIIFLYTSVIFYKYTHSQSVNLLIKSQFIQRHNMM